VTYDVLLSCGSSLMAVPMPMRMASCIVRIQCVMIMLSFPLRMSCFPLFPAIFASKDWAKVSVTQGRDEMGSVVYLDRMQVGNSGGSTIKLLLCIIFTQLWHPNRGSLPLFALSSSLKWRKHMFMLADVNNELYTGQKRP
jgi:hypothetical protein